MMLASQLSTPRGYQSSTSPIPMITPSHRHPEGADTRSSSRRIHEDRAFIQGKIAGSWIQSTKMLILNPVRDALRFQKTSNHHHLVFVTGHQQFCKSMVIPGRRFLSRDSRKGGND